jgi:DNA topoisomerase-1
MAKPLIIVESPAKAKTIGKYLDNKYTVKASMGHVRDLPKKEIGVDVDDNFKPKYVIDASKKKLINELKHNAAESDSIYLASDYDREGEAIAWHLANLLEKETKDKPVYRIVFNEITKKAITEAIEKPGKIDDNKVNAQQARRILDRIVGYKISPLLWRLLKNNLSAGRVQSVALRLICERDDAIKAFVPEEFWSIEAEFWRDNLPHFKAVLQQFNGEKINLKNEEQTKQILDELKDKQSQISAYKQSERFIQPPPPYITSTLQQDASRLLGFNGKKTMMIAQQLYEGLDIQGETLGLITYMRTDSMRISDEANEILREYIVKKLGKDKLFKTKRTFKNKNAAQDAHEAVRPTYPWRSPDDLKTYLSKDQLKLYDIIWKRFTATQIIPMKLSTVSIEISCGKAMFKATGSVILEKGFYEIYPHINVVTGENIDKDYQLNDLLEHDTISGKQHFTKPPAYFSEAQLIKELEAKGIGRPSTYASITNTIVERKYVEIKEKRFIPTDLGHIVNKFLITNFDNLFNVSFTAEMENKLDKIEYGEQEWQVLLKDYYEAIKDLMSKVNLAEAKKDLEQETDIICEKCNSKMVIKMSRKGEFLACSNYPKCKNAKSFEKDADGNIKVIEQTIEKSGIVCEKCGKEMLIKHSNKGEFLACSGYPKCKNAKSFTRDSEGKIIIEEPKTLEETCPKCQSKLVERKGKYGTFIACSNYPKCRFIKPPTTGVKCPECSDGEIVSKKSRKAGVFYACSNYPDCKFITNYKPVPTKCDNCGNYYLEVHPTKDKDPILVCPVCKQEYF